MEPATATQPSPPQPQEQATHRVLIVDDHAVVTRALSAILRRHGFVPTTFNTGHAAIEHVRNQRTDAVILDIHMPDISGLVVSQVLRQVLGDQVPIIILSGDVSMETLNSLPHVGATWFLSKPVKAEQVVAQLMRLLAG
jgi:CheY-like chemotaxis protein